VWSTAFLNALRCLQVPDLPTGDYVLSFRWDAEQVQQVWSHCADIHIANPKSPETTAVAPLKNIKNVCLGGSIGLDIDECDSWLDLFHSLNGPAWDPEHSKTYSTDPCAMESSMDNWNISVVCSSYRDILHITEIYLLGDSIIGSIPTSIGRLSQLRALSIVSTKITGKLPSSIGDLSNLEMVWLDHNPGMSGPIPASFSKLKLSVLEMEKSGLSGKMPALAYTEIPDCVLSGMEFECPLPPGAETCGAMCK
jgi:hypothetical protein